MKFKTSTAVQALVATQLILAPLAPAFAQTLDGNNWDLIRGVQIEEIVTETTYEVRKTFPAAIAEGASEFELTGFIALTFTDENVEEFILISDMGFCPYCGDPDHGASVPVKLSLAADKLEDGARVTIKGALVTNTDPETWQSLILSQAEIIS